MIKPKSYRGFIIITGDPTAPVDYPYRVGNCYFKSISEAQKEIDKTWKETSQAIKDKINKNLIKRRVKE